jgi:cullin-associated NEDD8-dissociated protein 1
LVLVLQGGLDSSFSTLLPVVQIILKQSDSGSITTHAGGSSTNLKIQVLDFLALVFKTHHLRSIQSSLSNLVPLITSSLTDKSPKVAAQAFVAASELVKLVKPISANGPGSPSVMGGNGTQIKSIFDATLTSLSRSDADQEVREKGIVCLGDLVVHCSADFGGDLQRALALLKERLRNENTRLVALQTIAKIADAPSAHKNVLYGSFLQDVAAEVVTFLRRNNKPVQAASFATLETILNKSGDSLPADTCEAIVSNLQPSIANPDIHLARSLNAISTVLDIHQDCVTTVESDVLPSVYELVASSSASTSGVTLEALRRFFAAYVSAGGDASDTVIAINDLAAASKGGLQVSVNASKCIGAIFGVAVEKDQAAAKKIVEDTAARVKVRPLRYFHMPSLTYKGVAVIKNAGERSLPSPTDCWRDRPKYVSWCPSDFTMGY